MAFKALPMQLMGSKWGNGLAVRLPAGSRYARKGALLMIYIS